MEKFFKHSLWCALGALFLLQACSPSGRSLHPVPNQSTSKPVDFVLIYVIHGDADYIYHDTSGHYYVADMEAVHQAVAVGAAAKHGEVFIFHQKSGYRFFNRAPRGFFYHYRNGIKLTQEEYTRSEIDLGLEFESKLFQSLAAPSSHYYLAYFGHKIPEKNGQGYSASFPKISFSLSEFSQGIKNLSPKDLNRTKPFNLIVLSTCQGGSPPTIEALAPLTDYLVASPEDLHLSFLNTLAFKNDSLETPGTNPPQRILNLADTITHQSFNQLKSLTQTKITVSLYDFSKYPDSVKQIQQLLKPARFGAL